MNGKLITTAHLILASIAYTAPYFRRKQASAAELLPRHVALFQRSTPIEFVGAMAAATFVGNL